MVLKFKGWFFLVCVNTYLVCYSEVDDGFNTKAVSSGQDMFVSDETPCAVIIGSRQCQPDAHRPRDNLGRIFTIYYRLDLITQKEY